MRFLSDSGPISVAVIGLGHVGLCMGAALAERGVHVVGVDSNVDLVRALDAGKCPYREPGLAELVTRHAATRQLRFTTAYEDLNSVDVVILAVGTPVLPDGRLADTQLRGASGALGPHLRPGQLVIVKSTVPPGTTRELVAPLLESTGLRAGIDFGLACCPERLSEGSALQEMATLPVVVGGWCDESAKAASAFWSRCLGAEVSLLPSPEAAEIVKLASNWWIDLNIAMGNELAVWCEAFGVDALDVIDAANQAPKGTGHVNILLPSVGVGGSCLTKDPWMAWRSAQDRGVEISTIPAGRAANDRMPQHTCDLITQELSKVGKCVASARVAVLGLAFKNNTGDLRSTPTQPVVAELRRQGAQVRLFDPLVDSAVAETEFGQPMALSLEEAVAGADCVALLAWHRELAGVDLPALRNTVAEDCVVVDGRAYLSRSAIATLERAGFTYRGIGR